MSQRGFLPPPYKALTVTSGGLANQLRTKVTVLPAVGPNDPEPVGHSAMAVWDTGASKSVIAPGVARALGLVPVGSQRIHHAGGDGVFPTYLVTFLLPNGVGFTGALVTENPLTGFDVLLGMDVICMGDFAVTNFQGKTVMTFRSPPQASIDFVKEHNRAAFRDIGRNDPCPCGTKDEANRPLKFKNCHLGKT